MSEELLRVVRNVGRLMALQKSGLLDTPPEESFDRFTRLASHTLSAPIALLSLVDGDRQFFKSARGLDQPLASRRQTPLSHSFCKYVVEAGDVFLVQDARKTPIVQDSPAVDEFHVIAYAGMPVRTDEGHVIGTLCVMDQRPRAWTSGELRALRDLADCVTEEIQLRTHLREAEQARRQSETRLLELRKGET
ncbi:MAG: GAF domain-containing protein [Acidobacteria bacterium]|nr:GAF domain-containing protein [Acidobacteriota bacterium]